MISRDVIFGFLEEAGRAETGGRENLTLRDVFEQLGGKGSHATRDIAREMGITQRQVQRMLTETGAEKRGMGPKSIVGFRELNANELRRAGARYFRENPLYFEDGSEFALCYGGEQQGDEREVRGDAVVIEDNSDWLDAFDARDYALMQRRFTDAFLEAYGVSAGDLDICDEDDGSNLHVAL